jgi:photosystem II stability/assembly factor-like uncharacterized protein
VFLSANNGTSWTAVNSGMTNLAVHSLAVCLNGGTNIIAGTMGSGVFLSTNNGASWLAVNSGLMNSSDNTILSLAVSGNNIFAGTYGGVFLSNNNGTSWTAMNTGLACTSLNAIAVSNDTLFAGTSGGSGIYKSANNGAKWSSWNSGLTYTSIYSLAVSGNNIFAGTYGDGAWKRSTSQSDGIEEINDKNNNITVFPNPVTNNLQIQTVVPIINIEVTDITGRLLCTTSAKNINCSNYASGVYFIRATTNKGVVVKKFVKE